MKSLARQIALIDPFFILLLYVAGPTLMVIINGDGQIDATEQLIGRTAGTLFILASVGWPAAVLFFLKAEFYFLDSVRNNIGFLFLVIFVVVLTAAILGAPLGSDASQITDNKAYSSLLKAIGMVGVLSLLMFYWKVADAFIAVGRVSTNVISARIITFFQVFYLCIGVFFLSRKLRAASLGPASAA